MVQNRRIFLKLTSTTLSFMPLVRLLGSDEEQEEEDAYAAEKFNQSRELHYLDKNLANIHIYFINIIRNRRNYCPEDYSKNCYIIFSIPSQHLNERHYQNKPESNIEAHLACHSFLCFRIWDKVKEQKEKKIKADITNLLAWENAEVFHFITTKDIKQSLFKSYDTLCDLEDAGVVEDAANPERNVRPSDLNYYKDVLLAKLLKSNSDPDGYLSIIEVPAKLFIAPHIRVEDWIARFETSRSEIKEFLLQPSGTIRKVRELWHARLYFSKAVERKGVSSSQSLDDFPPVFRILGFRGKIKCDPKAPCKLENSLAEENFLPQLIDRAELTFLNQLAENSKFRDEKFDLKATADFTFTALGATAKLHYKNLESGVPAIDLVEYEHHITLGRDEYIKVARIGIIAGTAQKALHIRLARRRYDDDTNASFMYYDQFVELVEKEKDYERGLAGQDIFPEHHMPFAWRRKELAPGADSYDLRKPPPVDPHPYYHTNFRRFPFRKVRITEEIKDRPVRICDIKKDICPDPINILPEAFWVLKKADYSDFIMDGWYWDKEVKDEDLGKMEFAKPFSLPLLFIRKSAFVTCKGKDQEPITHAQFEDNIFTHFVKHKNNSRRRFDLHDKAIALTPRLDEAKEREEKSNSTNSPKTRFLEYYFDPKDWRTYPPAERDPKEYDWFDQTYFPIYPQIKEGEIASEQGQEYLQQYMPMPVAINEDYVYCEFSDVAKTYDLLAPGIKNHGKIILDVLNTSAHRHYDASMNAVNNIYKEATDKIGGISVPDPKVEALSLRENALQIPKKINQVLDTKFVRILDILRGEDEVLGGIKVKDIINEFVDLKDTPLYEIEKQLRELKEKVDNIAEEVEKKMNGWKEAFKGSKFITEVLSRVRTLEQKIQQLKKEYHELKGKVVEKFNSLKKLKDDFDREFKSYEALVNSYKMYFDMLRIEAYQVLSADPNYYLNLVKKEMVLIGKDIFVQYLNDWKDRLVVDAWIARVKAKLDKPDLITQLENIANLIHKHLPLVYDAAVNIDISKVRELRNYLRDSSKELPVDNLQFIKRNAVTLANVSYQSLLQSIENTRLVIKKNDKELLKQLYTALFATALPPDFEAQLKQYLVDCESMAKSFEAEFNKKADAELTKVVETISRNINIYRDDLATAGLYSDVLTIIEIIDNVKKLSPYYYYERYFQLKKDYEDQFRKLEGLLAIFNAKPGQLEDFKRIIQDQVKIIVRKYEKELEDYVAKYLTGVVDTDLQKLYDSVKNTRENDVKDFIQTTVKQEIKDRLARILVEQTGYDNLNDLLRAKEKELAKYLATQAGEYLTQVQQHVQDVLDDLKRTVQDMNECKEYAMQALHFLEMIKTPQTKNINFKWQTEKFRDKNLGMLAFKSGVNPKTILSVDVATTIHYSLFKFPNVIDKITNSIDSRLANFGIGFLNILIIDFHEVAFQAGTDRPTKFSIKIGQVRFEGALSFVQAFESWLKTLGEGFRLELTPINVGIGYTLKIPDIKTPSFNFFNLSLNFDFRIYFKRRPMSFTFSLARKESKFGLSAGILGGFGFFSITAEPKRGITGIAMALEFGAYLGISLGPIGGEVKLVAGIYYSKDDYEVVVEGYILFEGTLSVWIISISARVYLGMISRNSSIEGMCSVTYSAKLGFIKKSFTGTYRKQIRGAQNQNRDATRIALREANEYYSNSLAALNKQEEDYMLSKVSPAGPKVYELADFNDFKTYYEAFIA